MMITDKNVIRQTLKQFIKVNHTNNTVHVSFDDACIFLMNHCGRIFSPAKFERYFSEESKKLTGKPICEQMFNDIAQYIDEMTLRLHVVGIRAGEERRIKSLAEKKERRKVAGNKMKF